MRVAAVILGAVLRADADENIKWSNAHVDGMIDEMRYREIREEHIMYVFVGFFKKSEAIFHGLYVCSSLDRGSHTFCRSHAI